MHVSKVCPITKGYTVPSRSRRVLHPKLTFSARDVEADAASWQVTSDPQLDNGLLVNGGEVCESI